MTTSKKPARENVMLKCPVCSAACITEKARSEVDIFASMQCPACKATLRLKWARSIVISHVLAFATLCAWLWFGVGRDHLGPYIPFVGPLIVVSIVTLVVLQRKLPLTKDN